ncbi:hypothetical protein HJC23_002499 [Cyclotella cryptica]|uniref:Uncharacterized protein n=1 Tax=Cyclotella cryptica TaxID=29204 RepID=A0ABD3QVT6_9STRA|eukprot:CCRYP_001315-RA/>CCRYP_001315-RA protein AED:0.24 eAED:0.24 QI:0/-1/0/1/-1/1/1/0/621
MSYHEAGRCLAGSHQKGLQLEAPAPIRPRSSSCPLKSNGGAGIHDSYITIVEWNMQEGNEEYANNSNNSSNSSNNKGTKRKEPGDTNRTNKLQTSQVCNDHACDSTAHPLSSISHKHGYRIVSLHEWLDGCHCQNKQQQESMLHDAATAQSMQPSLPLPLVDLRPRQEFEQRHLSLATPKTINNAKDNRIVKVPVVNLPLPTLLSGERSCELPPRHVEFAILIPSIYRPYFTQDESASSSSSPSSSIHQFFFATQSKATHQSRKPWLVRQVLIEDEQNFWSQAESLNVLVQNNKHHILHHESTNGAFQKMDKLWKPDTLVSSQILSLLKEWVQNSRHATRNNSVEQGVGNTHGSEQEMSDKPTGVVLDLGSGAGRDICFLAEELKHFHQSDFPVTTTFPLQFIGIDNHKGSSKRCLPLWKHRGVEDITQSIHLDLNKLDGVHDLLNSAISSQSLQDPGHDVKPILCIFAIRYLNRKLFSYLAHSFTDNAMHGQDEITIESNKSRNKTSLTRKQNGQHSELPQPPRLSLPKGTIIAISHFCKPHPNADWNFDHPKESHVLERWELKHMFQNVVVSTVAAAADVDDRHCTNGEVKCWKIVKDDICLDGDHGRTLIQFVAVKIV